MVTMKKLLIIALLLAILMGCKKEEIIYHDITEVEANVVYYANKDYTIRVRNTGCQNFELRMDKTENPNYVIFFQDGGNSSFWTKEFEINEGNYFIFDACLESLRYTVL